LPASFDLRAFADENRQESALFDGLKYSRQFDENFGEIKSL
jgi:hypothetical protein